MKSKKFYLLANQMKDPDGSITKKVGDYLGSLGMEYAIRPRDDNSLKGTRYLYSNPDDVPEGTDCIIAMGGDGTILQASRDLHALQIPILGVNIGTLGFLTDATMETIFESIDKFIANEYELDTRMMIYGQVYRGQEMVYENFALNDPVSRLKRTACFSIVCQCSLFPQSFLICHFNIDLIFIIKQNTS